MAFVDVGRVVVELWEVSLWRYDHLVYGVSK